MHRRRACEESEADGRTGNISGAVERPKRIKGSRNEKEAKENTRRTGHEVAADKGLG